MRALEKEKNYVLVSLSTAPVDARNHASPAEVVACFHDQRNVLGRLAFLITGDHATADQAVVQACEITLQGNSPFRDWLLEWAKTATIASAISHGTEAIRVCEAAYEDRRCPHVEQLCQFDDERRAASLALILQIDAQKIIAQLDPLCRAILALRIAIRSSMQDCSLRLNVSRAAVLAANCHAMTWLDYCYVEPLEDGSQRFACPLEHFDWTLCPTPPWSGAPLGLRIGGSHDDRTR